MLYKEEEVGLGKDLSLHDLAIKRFNLCFSASQEERKQSQEDRRFYSICGAQWEGTFSEQFAEKPQLEINKTHLAVLRIINEYRNNRITADFISKTGDDEDLASTCDGLYRADEWDSSAEEAYDNAFEEGVSGGFGAWRVVACEDEDNEEDENEYQRIMFEPIFDADNSVYFDLNAKKYDKSDAKYCFVITSISKESFEDNYGEFPSSFPKDTELSQFDWATPDYIYIAEYYVCEYNEEKMFVYSNLQGDEITYNEDELDEEILMTLEATGSKLIEEKKKKVKRVHKYLLCGDRVLEDCGFIAGKHIPIVPFYGKRWYINGLERFSGIVRYVKDVQRLYNMQVSRLAEISALSPVETPVFFDEQIRGHETRWAEANLKNYPYLTINPITDAMGNIVPSAQIGSKKAPEIPQATAALISLTNQDINDVMGNQQAGEQVIPNISGKAIELIQNRLDMQSYIYMSNMAKSVRRCGQIWLSMAREVYIDEARPMRTIGEQENFDIVKLMQPTVDEKTGEIKYKNDIKKASFDIIVNVGPSSSSKRNTTVRNLGAMLQYVSDPETAQVLQSLMLMNMDGEGIEDARRYFRKRLVNMGVIEPTKTEQEEMTAQMQNTPPDPNTVYLEKAAANEEAKAVKALADAELTQAKTEETKAKTLETLDKIGNTAR